MGVREKSKTKGKTLMQNLILGGIVRKLRRGGGEREISCFVQKYFGVQAKPKADWVASGKENHGKLGLS